MGKSNQYYLVARDRISNEFDIISFLGKRGCSLEEIDLYTTGFKDEEDLAKFLREQGLISNNSTDFFIVNRNKNKSVFKQEVIYSKCSTVRDIAEASLNRNIEKCTTRIDSILDSFADKMRRSPNLYEQVLSGCTNIYEKYAQYFIFTRTNLASIKYRDGGWARTSYPLIRNVVEATSRGNMRYDYMSDKMYRDLLDEKLVEVTDPEYNPDQLSLFDSLMDEIVPVDEDKLFTVLGTFEKLPATTILMDDKGAYFNKSLFFDCKREDLDKLSTLLSSDLRLMLRLFLVQRDMYNITSDKTGSANDIRIKRRQKALVDLFKNHPEQLNKAYDWCMLYNTYLEKTLGDVDGKEYGKRRED